MEHIRDFKPLERLVLPDVGELDCAGLILIVGPNSSGKTQLLHDIYQRIRGEPRPLVVAEEVSVRKPEYQPLLDCLQREGYIQKIVDPNGNVFLRPMTTYLGTGEGAAQISPDQAKALYDNYEQVIPLSKVPRIPFLNHFGRMLVTALFLDRRLIAVNTVAQFDYLNNPPSTDLQALYLNDNAQAELEEETIKAFSKAVWLDFTRVNVLRLLVAEKSEIPTDRQRRSASEMNRCALIETEGDGLKSYVASCIGLLLGRRPVCVLDEPELCLHPPQAYRLGRFIGKFATSKETATFVATHSSQILRGIIQTTQDLQIVRLTRTGRAFHAHRVPSETLVESLKKPRVQAEVILDGVFAQGVVVVEADADRMVYQAVWESLGEEYGLDLHFAAVGGTGGMFDTCKLYRALQIPVAVIADLDIIKDMEGFRRVAGVLSDEANAKGLSNGAGSIMSAIKALPPTISVEDVKQRLGDAISTEMDWARDDDTALLRCLEQITQELDRMRRLKRGGIPALPAELGARLSGVVEAARPIGLFIVPVGELEEWLKDEPIQASKEKKWAWANEAAVLVRQMASKKGDVWDFMRGIGRYLTGSGDR